MLTTIDPSRIRQDLSYDAYEYTVCSHRAQIAAVRDAPNADEPHDVSMKAHTVSRLLCRQPCLQACLVTHIDRCCSLQVHSHTYDTAEIPSAKFTYDLSPIQILVSEKHRAW